MKKIKIMGFTLTLVWMIIIFSFSHQTAKVSDEISRNIVTSFIINHYNEYDTMDAEEQIHFADTLDLIIRKIAHFMEYAVLGFFYSIILYSYSLDKKYGWIKFIIASSFLCLLYSSSDEIHQLFIAGRNGNIKDVILDTSGGVFGTVIYVLFIRFYKKCFCHNKSII